MLQSGTEFRHPMVLVGVLCYNQVHLAGFTQVRENSERKIISQCQGKVSVFRIPT